MNETSCAVEITGTQITKMEEIKPVVMEIANGLLQCNVQENEVEKCYLKETNSGKMSRVHENCSMLLVHIKEINSIIGGIYRPHDYDFDTFMSKVDEFFDVVQHSFKACWIVGDLYGDYLTNNQQNRALEKMIDANGFELLNWNIPPRVTPTSSTLIDYILSNNIRDAQLTIVDGNIGDHRLQIIHINSPVESRNNPRSRCEINELDRIAFRDKLAMQDTEWTNPDDLCNEIIRAFTISQSPWFNVEIYELLRERDFHYRRHQQFLANPHLKEDHKDAQGHRCKEKAIFS
ncbi:hypothetical protein HHI36_011138 [Cryptolaemus montrouzieri]|uniref:Uncharacterized protein n=1 Tax=Cryptolaemus montrouzieri TaxID=559131 RepID=A0ABD2MKX4_9CUCU